ncbi:MULTISPECIES: hypothetical protein [Paraburkholderia]|uniref:hypothetical protein n=1 Tax=Paraburkholderia TaxID=1822464 RepID=UPI0013A6FA6D|nr:MULTISPECIES: hypothetical protein [Paraburkholderia]MDH6150510.1 hypothetical protein [Paraburkholderia sp. WSM4179]
MKRLDKIHRRAASTLLLAFDASRDPDHDAVDRAREAAVVDRLLDVARRHGFDQEDALRGLLDRGEYSSQLIELTRRAMAVIPVDELSDALRDLG